MMKPDNLRQRCIDVKERYGFNPAGEIEFQKLTETKPNNIFINGEFLYAGNLEGEIFRFSLEDLSSIPEREAKFTPGFGGFAVWGEYILLCDSGGQSLELYRKKTSGIVLEEKFRMNEYKPRWITKGEKEDEFFITCHKDLYGSHSFSTSERGGSFWKFEKSGLHKLYSEDHAFIPHGVSWGNNGLYFYNVADSSLSFLSLKGQLSIPKRLNWGEELEAFLVSAISRRMELLVVHRSDRLSKFSKDGEMVFKTHPIYKPNSRSGGYQMNAVIKDDYLYCPNYFSGIIDVFCLASRDYKK